MEKRTYTVEWLSESSNMSFAHTNMDLLKNRLGPAAVCQSQVKDTAAAGSAGGQEDSTAASAHSHREKDYTGGKKVFHEDSRVVALQQLPQEFGFPINAQRDMSADRPSPSKDEDGCSDVDSFKSTESVTSEEDSSSSRPRTKFSEEQLQELEKSFTENRYIGASEKKRLSNVLKLSETQIKTWFQNRRMKFKRQRQDARVDAFFSRLYLPYYSYSDVQTPSCSLQPDLAMPVPFPPPPPPPLPPQPGSLPYNSMHPVRPGISGHHPAPPILPPTNYGPCPLPPMLLHPMLNEPSGLRFNPY
uniref:Homeobox domain-containing protein n=1 Tax=Leptobrachium leishanense TaxID=445787 RepID=A0A8C5PL39_9ANUR